jgi:nucleotide-binding universal stress UspA family protein
MEGTMATKTVPPGAIVVGVDGSAAATAALTWAVGEAGRRELPLHVLHALDQAYWQRGSDARTPEQVEEITRAALDHVRKLAPDLELRSSEPHEAPRPALVAASRDATEIVLGRTGAGALHDALVGSVAVSVAAEAHCPVVLVRHPLDEVDPEAPVVVGVAEDSRTAKALGFAFQEASRRGVPLVAVHAWRLTVGAFPTGMAHWRDAGREREVLSRVLTPWLARFPGVIVRGYTVEEDTGEALVRYTDGAALLVVGSHGRHGVGGLLLGSVSQDVMRHAHCPVVVVREEVGQPAVADRPTGTAP